MSKALIIGAGSIGLRHSRILDSMDFTVEFVTARTELDVKSFNSIEKAFHKNRFDLVVIANETYLHSRTLDEIIKIGYQGKTLVEKPLALHQTPSLIKMLQTENLAVGFNLRFHPFIQKLQTALISEDAVSMNVYAAQELSTWRSDRQDLGGYSASRKQGGGVLRDLSHELDYITLLGTKAVALTAIGGKLGTVTVDSDDSWSAILETIKIPQVSLQINYFDRPGSRTIRLVTEQNTYFADLRNHIFQVNGEKQDVKTIDPDYTYRKMHEDFLSGGGKSAKISDGIIVDDLILAFEKSAMEGSRLKF